MKVQTPRVLYSGCPLCGSPDLHDLAEVDCTGHPLLDGERETGLGPTIAWRRCAGCEHVFTAGHFTAEARALLSSTVRPEHAPGRDLERERRACARVVTTVTMVRGELSGRWLDVGFGDGALMTTADEFGYATTGLELCQELVDELTGLGYPALRCPIGELEGAGVYDVVSMDHVLQQADGPEEELRHAHRLLAPEGLLFVAAPNRDSFAFRVLDRDGANPCWSELEDQHLFSRDGLFALLRHSGFEPCHYAVSERRPASMEVIALRV